LIGIQEILCLYIYARAGVCALCTRARSMCEYKSQYTKQLHRKFYISLLLAVSSLWVIPKVQAQSSPPIQACIGGRSVFAVSGDTASSFRFFVRGGEVICSERNDSIVVQWGMQQGLARFSVQEIPAVDWIKAEMGLAYIEIPPECKSDTLHIYVDLRGRQFSFGKPSIAVSPGVNPNDVLPISRRLYNSIRWFDEDGNAIERFEHPGLFKVRVEDMHGCVFTDTITVTITGSSP